MEKATINVKAKDKERFNRLKAQYFSDSNLKKPPNDADFMTILLDKVG